MWDEILDGKVDSEIRSQVIHIRHVKKLSNLQKCAFLMFPYVFFEKNDPKLPRKRNVPIIYEEEKAPVELVSKGEEYYCQPFCQVIDMVVNCIRSRFKQKDYTETLQTMKILHLKALRVEDLDKSKLET